MKNVLILGGGFAGVAAALALKKQLKKLDAEITLIDRQSYHLFTPSLYEVASSEAPQGNIAIPFVKIFGNKVSLIKATISKIDTVGSKVTLSDNREISYDYLVSCLGSQSAYFGIPGLQENSLPLKTLAEAMGVKMKLHASFTEEKTVENPLRVFIGGGGFSGTELAAEIVNHRDSICKAHHRDKRSFEVNIIEGSDRLLSTLDHVASKLAKDRLEKNLVKTYLNSFIEKVDDKKIYIKDGPQLDYDLLVWTGGVVPNSLAKENNLPIDKRGGLLVNSYLQVENLPNVFAAGDNAFYFDLLTNKPAPGVAQVAEDEGRLAGENVANAVAGKPLKSYKLRHFGYIVPLKGRFAVAELNVIHLHGFLGWVLQQIVFLRYLLGILPFSDAFMRWNKFEMELMRD